MNAYRVPGEVVTDLPEPFQERLIRYRADITVRWDRFIHDTLPKVFTLWNAFFVLACLTFALRVLQLWAMVLWALA